MNRPAANARQAGAILAGLLTGVILLAATVPAAAQRDAARRNNVILFVGDGMDVSTVTYSRIAEHGVDGDLFLDRMPYTALSRTSSADDLVADSAAAMSAMMTGVNTNNGVIGYRGTPLTNVAELAKSLGYAVGIVTTARVTDATPAAVYAHVRDRGPEDDVAAQLVPGGPGYNARLGSGLDVILGGGQMHFLPWTRPDDRDLRAELQAQGYAYVDDPAGLEALGAGSRVLGLFTWSHMSAELYRGSREPGIVDMTAKAIEVLAATGRPYFLMVESGRIDGAHHAGNAFVAFVETRELDRAIGAAIEAVDLDRTLIMATADHGHVLTVAGSMVRPVGELPYAPRSAPASFTGLPYHGVFGTAHDIDGGVIGERLDSDGVPYTLLGYANGPGHREGPRVDPNSTPGVGGGAVVGTSEAWYHQEATVPRKLETHGGVDVAVHAIGSTAENVRGTVRNTQVFHWIAAAFGETAAADPARDAAGSLPAPSPKVAAPSPGVEALPAGAADRVRTVEAPGALGDPGGDGSTNGPAGRNDVILFVGDGMGLSTVTFSRIAEHGVDGDLFLDRMPYTALSRTASADHIAGDSAAAMTAMMTGVRSSSGVIGYPPATERLDFNRDGDGPPLTNVAELAKSLGYAVGIVTTAGVTDATPAAVYAHVNDRDRENDVAAQLVPGGAGYNARLGGGLDVVFGGGRRHFVPTGATDEEGGAGRRADARDLRAELQAQGYAYVWNRDGFEALGAGDRAVGLFAPRHMEYEFDRGDGSGNEPGIVGMTVKAIEILASTGRPYFLMVESGRIDHAHRAGNDRLADEGVRFTHAYSHPACTPSRVALMTGKSNVRNYADFGVLLPGQYTIADLFEEAGYATAIAGKWQLHGSSTVAGTPAGAGFDTYCLWQTADTGDSRYWGPSIECDGEIVASTSDDYGPDMFTDFLLEFIESNRDGPFFAYYPMVLPHSPFVAPPQSSCRGETYQCHYEEMVGRLDYNVGRIHDKLAELELLDTTLVLFTSDNGTPRHVAAWFEEELIYGDKRVPTDGGTRVPLIVRGPVSGGRVLDDLIDFTDFLPTLADAAGVTLPEDATLDGVSFWDRLLGGEGRPREWVHTYYFSDPYVREFATPSSHHEISYARDRRYKLYGTGELFDVPADRYEVHPLPGGDEESRAARARLQAALDSMPARGREIRWPQVTASASTTDPFLRWRPVLSRATVNGAELTLAYAGVLNTDAAPPVRSFGVRVDGAEREVVAVSMSAGAVTLTLGAAVTAGQTVTVMYNPAGSRSISHANRDGGNRAAPLFREAVTNETRNRPPAPVGTLAPVMLPVSGGAAAVDAAAAFRDEEGDTLTWAAVSSSPEVATVSVSGSVLTVTPLAAGETTVTVTVTDAGGSGGTATQSFRVTVPEEDVGVDYDADNDGLIEIATLAQLDAVRHDLDGDGVPAGSGAPPAAGTGAASGAAGGSGAAGTGTAAGTAAAAGSGTTAAGSGTGAAGASAASSGAAAAAGSGEALAPGAAAHAAAFPDAAEGLGCPSGGCLGYELAADLDFDTDGSGAADAGDAFWNGGAGWRPLGTFDEPFTGVFAGNGRTVSHLFVGSGDNAGLFGMSSGVIRGVGVVDADVTGSRCAGALLGLNGGRVEASWSTGAVTGDSCVGGLVGVNGLWVPDGGTFRPLAGFVTASWSAADVTAEQWVGGLVGYSNGTVAASYATGDVTATTDGSGAGGLVGRMGFGDNRITASYATGAVSGPGGSVGGFVGHAMPHDRVTASYWDTEASGVTRGGGGVGRTTAALQEPTGYSGPYAAWDVDVDGDGVSDAPWDFGTSSAYPALSVDADGDGMATWRELGLQGRAVAPSAESEGGAPGAGVKAGAAAGRPTARAQPGVAASRRQTWPPFTDDPLVPGVTPVRAAHLLELRSRIDALRLRAGLPAFGWTDARVVPGVTPARALHLTELRSALGEAYGAAGRSAPGYTDAAVKPGVTAMRVMQLQELRSAVVALEGTP